MVIKKRTRVQHKEMSQNTTELRLEDLPEIKQQLITKLKSADMALVVDSNNNFHGVLVDAGNGKVLASTQMSMAAMMQSGLGRGMGMMGPEFMMQHGMMKGPGMVMGH
jgi:hypothetical protein